VECGGNGAIRCGPKYIGRDDVEVAQKLLILLLLATILLSFQINTRRSSRSHLKSLNANLHRAEGRSCG
jgi:hypothetical protein